jgi:ABC-type Na+ transport system ATPase subunit NatA
VQTAIQTWQLSKTYHGRPALNAMDLVVPADVVFGYLGPNGAGKTTTIRLLAGCCGPVVGARRSAATTSSVTASGHNARSVTFPVTSAGIPGSPRRRTSTISVTSAADRTGSTSTNSPSDWTSI